MKLVNNIKIRVFVTPSEDEKKIKEALVSLVPFNLEQEKISMSITEAKGFEEKTIKIIELMIEKERHTTSFIKYFFNVLVVGQKAKLRDEINTRIDEQLVFFLRLEKDELLNGKYIITDSGNCYHFSFSLACFPRKIDIATAIAKRILS